MKKKIKKIKMNKYKYIRSFELRYAGLDESSRRLEGRAIVFNEFSRDLGGFIERIDNQAVTEDLLKESDIILNFNHDNNQMLARYTNGSGTLNLDLREDGLWFSCDAPETSLGEEILYHVKSGNLFECSFACLIDKKDIERYKENGQYIQVIHRIDTLLDVSIVSRAAYGTTSVSARSEEAAKEEFEEIKREIDAAEEEKRIEEERIEEEKRKQEILDKLESIKTQFLEDIKIS